MEEVKYIPGDLVMTNGAPIGTKNGIAYVVTASDPDRTVTFEDGTVLKGSVTLDNIKGKDFKDNGYLFGASFAWVKHIIPIPLTPKILEANGWKYKRESGIDTYTFGENISNSITIEANRDKELCLTVSDSTYVNLKVKHVHDLQHLLFSLGLNSNLKV